MNDYLIQNTVHEFWEQSGLVPAYPCDFHDAVLWALPLEVIEIVALGTSDVNRWAQQIGTVYRFSGRNRRLRGCLIAYQDVGTVLLDGADPQGDQRFTLAHESAHFLLDYQAPRRRALDTLGEAIRPVLDGLRRPTQTERVHALLANAPLGVLSHLMERPEEGAPVATVLEVEDRADRLALELLAPESEVRRRFGVDMRTLGFEARLTRLQILLITEFDLPRAIAAGYARALLESWGGFTVRDWLFGTVGKEER